MRSILVAKHVDGHVGMVRNLWLVDVTMNVLIGVALAMWLTEERPFHPRVGVLPNHRASGIGTGLTE